MFEPEASNKKVFEPSGATIKAWGCAFNGATSDYAATDNEVLQTVGCFEG